MARAKFGALLTELRGKIGGSVFQSNKYGFTMKNSPNMVNPSSQATLSVRNIFINAIRHWQQIPQANRDMFNAYALAFPQYARNNPAALLSGYTIATRWWTALLLGGFGFDNEPDMATIPFPVLTPIITRSGSELNLALVGDIYSEFTRYTCSLSSIVPGSRDFHPSSFRIVYTFEDTASPADVASIYLSIFGRLPEPGEIVFLKVSMYSIVNPQVLADQYFKLSVL